MPPGNRCASTSNRSARESPARTSGERSGPGFLDSPTSSLPTSPSSTITRKRGSFEHSRSGSRLRLPRPWTPIGEAPLTDWLYKVTDSIDQHLRDPQPPLASTDLVGLPHRRTTRALLLLPLPDWVPAAQRANASSIN